MESINIIGSLEQIWDKFFYPTIFLLSFIGLMMIIFDKRKIINYCKTNIIRVTHENRTFKLKNQLYVPVSKYETIILEYITAHKSIIVIGLVIILYLFKKMLIMGTEIFPLTYYYTQDYLILNVVNEYTLASIWEYYPNLSFTQLCNKILDISKNSYWGTKESTQLYHQLSMFLQLSLLVISLINIYSLFKRHWHILRKGLFFICIFSISLYGITYLQVREVGKDLEQRCYYAHNQVELLNINSVHKKSDDNFIEKLRLMKEKDVDIWGIKFKSLY